MKARIEEAIDGDGLWLLIDGEEETAHAIEEDEVEPIMRACIDWLVKKDKS